MTKLLIISISLYQRILSPDHSFWGKKRYPLGYCQYYPSCSEYSRQAFIKYGFFHGMKKTIFRIIRCNPFSSGGIDKI